MGLIEIYWNRKPAAILCSYTVLAILCSYTVLPILCCYTVLAILCSYTVLAILCSYTVLAILRSYTVLAILCSYTVLAILCSYTVLAMLQGLLRRKDTVTYRAQKINSWEDQQAYLAWSDSFISIQPLGRFSRNQNPVRWPVWLWHTASWASS